MRAKTVLRGTLRVLAFALLILPALGLIDAAPPPGLQVSEGVLSFTLQARPSSKATRIEVSGPGPIAAVEVVPDREGRVLRARASDWDAGGSRWVQGAAHELTFMPTGQEEGTAPRPWP